MFTKLTDEKSGEMNQQVFDSIAKYLMYFEDEADKSKRFDMGNKLLQKTHNHKLIFTPDLFHCIIYILTESQQWKMI